MVDGLDIDMLVSKRRNFSKYDSNFDKAYIWDSNTNQSGYEEGILTPISEYFKSTVRFNAYNQIIPDYSIIKRLTGWEEFSNNGNTFSYRTDKLSDAALEYAADITTIIDNDEYVGGQISGAERFMERKAHVDNFDDIFAAIMHLYANNLNNPHLLEGLLTMLANVPFAKAEPIGQIMAMGLLSHKDISVRKKAIQCFEKWNAKESLKYLENIKMHPEWLQNYLDKVIKYVRRDGV